MRSACALGLAALACAACGDIFGTKDAHQPGTPLGTFHVTAARSSNTCGDGALGTASDWAFDVLLARAEGELFWNNGQELITGTVAADGVTFEFQTGIVVDMRQGQPAGKPACSIGRADTATGTLGSATNDVTGFEGALAYAFAATQGSDCTDLVDGAMPVVAALPCSMEYAITAQRTKLPAP